MPAQKKKVVVAAKPAAPAASKPKREIPFDERAPKQGPLGEVPRYTESELIAKAAKEAE